jgi:HD superfamily phosphohydrolase
VLLPGYWVDLEDSRPGDAYLLDLLFSDVDMDRMDYVARDTYHVSPDFKSQFDWKGFAERFVRNSVLVNLPVSSSRVSLAFDSEIQGDVQGFLLYRRRLYEELYLGPPKISIDTMISHALYYCLAKHSMIGDPIAQDILKFTDDELKFFLRFVGPENTRALINAIYKEDYYEFIHKDQLPSTNANFEWFVAEVQGPSGFTGRVQAERKLADNLPTDLLKDLGDLPPVLFSIPPTYRPTDEISMKLAELEASRQAIINTPEGAKWLTEIWEPYVRISPINSFYLLVPKKLTSSRAIIVETFMKLVGERRLL